MWNQLILPTEYDEVVLFSAAVHRAFAPMVFDGWQFPDFDGLKLHYLSGREWRLYSCPHPSGLVRWWNVAQNRAAGASFLRGVLDRTRR